MATKLQRAKPTSCNLATFGRRFVRAQMFPAGCQLRFFRLGTNDRASGHDKVTVLMPNSLFHIKDESSVAEVLKMAKACLPADEKSAYDIEFWGPNAAGEKTRTVKLNGRFVMKTLRRRNEKQEVHLGKRAERAQFMSDANDLVEEMAQWAKKEHRNWRAVVRNMVGNALARHCA